MAGRKPFISKALYSSSENTVLQTAIKATWCNTALLMVDKVIEMDKATDKALHDTLPTHDERTIT